METNYFDLPWTEAMARQTLSGATYCILLSADAQWRTPKWHAWKSKTWQIIK